MDRSFYTELAERSLGGDLLEDALCVRILEDAQLELLPLLDAAYQVRRVHHGHKVSIHILNNAENGHCPEDCAYCAQGRGSEAAIVDYGMKSEAEILAEAQRAYAAGGHRYCMVFSGRGPSPRRIQQLCHLIKTIKARYPIEVCVSAGLVDAAGAQALKAAGLDRLNHNLNTSEDRYPQICTTHSYQDRLDTLHHARSAGLEVCSGMIIGMGETAAEIIEVAKTLRSLGAESIPVNFLVPIEGNALTYANELTPTYCLRVLALFRFLNPSADIRAAAGREGHLRSMEVLCLYPANSLFLDGYLNTKGGDTQRVLRMIQDAGFTIQSEIPLEDLLHQQNDSRESFAVEGHQVQLKTDHDLKPSMQEEGTR